MCSIASTFKIFCKKYHVLRIFNRWLNLLKLITKHTLLSKTIYDENEVYPALSQSIPWTWTVCTVNEVDTKINKTSERLRQWAIFFTFKVLKFLCFNREVLLFQTWKESFILFSRYFSMVLSANVMLISLKV